MNDLNLILSVVVPILAGGILGVCAVYRIYDHALSKFERAQESERVDE